MWLIFCCVHSTFGSSFATFFSHFFMFQFVSWFFQKLTMQKSLFSFNFMSRFRSPSEHWAHMKAVKKLDFNHYLIEYFFKHFFIFFFFLLLFLFCFLLEKFFFYLFTPQSFSTLACFVSLHWNRLESTNSECSFGELFLTNLIIKRQFKIIKIMGAITFALIAQNYIAKWLIFLCFSNLTLSCRRSFDRKGFFSVKTFDFFFMNWLNSFNASSNLIEDYNFVVFSLNFFW